MTKKRESRVLRLVFNHCQRLFHPIAGILESIPVNPDLLPKANNALTLMAGNPGSGLPDLPDDVLKLIFVKFSDFIIAQQILEHQHPEEIPPDPPEGVTDEEILAFVMRDLLTNQPLLRDPRENH